MGKRRVRNQIDGHRTRVVSVSVDIVTDTIVKALMEREGGSFSASICALATDAGMRDEGLKDVVKAMVADTVRNSLEKSGFQPGFSRTLARELTTGHKRPHPDTPMPLLDAGDNRMRVDGKEPTDGHI